jgi:CheY-like chemotaxis protein
MLVLSRKPGEGIVIDGCIRVDVVEVRGGRVRLGVTAPRQLPVRRQGARPDGGASAASGPAPARRPGVLVVDDEAAVRAELAAALEREGFAVWAAAGGVATLGLCLREGGAIDVALVDERMPGMDGPEMLGALRRLAPRLPCCLMTARPEAYTAERLRALGAACVVTKPFRMAEVAAALRRAAGLGPGGGGR